MSSEPAIRVSVREPSRASNCPADSLNRQFPPTEADGAMAKRSDRVVVIDVAATCWNGAPPSDEISEILEIGVCTVDLATLQRFDRRSLLVRPQRSQVSDFCLAQTGLTRELLATGMTLAEALGVLRIGFGTHERLFASWGDTPRRQFQQACAEYELECPFGPNHLNIQTLFAVTCGASADIELSAALQQVGLTTAGTSGRSVDEAWDAAGLLTHLLRRVKSDAS